MHEIVIPMVPSRNLVGKAGWWRNAHNDRVVWHDRVRRALAGLTLDGAYVAFVWCDWQARPKPVSGGALELAIMRETAEALREGGVDVQVLGATLAQSGRGQGETRIHLVERD